MRLLVKLYRRDGSYEYRVFDEEQVEKGWSRIGRCGR
jgi:hypothetical protein